MVRFVLVEKTRENGAKKRSATALAPAVAECFTKTFRHGGGCLGPLGCLGAVVTGPSKGRLFSGGGGLFRGLFRAGRWRVHHRHKNRQAGVVAGGPVGGGFDQNISFLYTSSSLLLFLSYSLFSFLSLHLPFSKIK